MKLIREILKFKIVRFVVKVYFIFILSIQTMWRCFWGLIMVGVIFVFITLFEAIGLLIPNITRPMNKSISLYFRREMEDGSNNLKGNKDD